MTLHDVFNRVHPTPVDADQEVLFERFMHGDLDDYADIDPLPSPNTWETVISERGNTRIAVSVSATPGKSKDRRSGRAAYAWTGLTGGLTRVGLAVAVVAVVGWVAFDWGFDINDGTVPLVLGVGAAMLAVGATVYRRVGD